MHLTDERAAAEWRAEAEARIRAMTEEAGAKLFKPHYGAKAKVAEHYAARPESLPDEVREPLEAEAAAAGMEPRAFARSVAERHLVAAASAFRTNLLRDAALDQLSRAGMLQDAAGIVRQLAADLEALSGA